MYGDTRNSPTTALSAPAASGWAAANGAIGSSPKSCASNAVKQNWLKLKGRNQFQYLVMRNDRMKELIRKLCDAYGPSGQETAVRDLIRQALTDVVDELRVDALGNLIAIKRPK